MNRDSVILIATVAIIAIIFGAVFVLGLQQAVPDRSGEVAAPIDADVPPEVIEGIRDDPPPVRYSEGALTPDRPDAPPNEVLVPPEPSPDDVTKPPAEDPESCVTMEFVSPPSTATANEAFTLLFHERVRTPFYKGDVINFIFISPAKSNDLVVQVPLQHGKEPFRNVDVKLSDGDGYAWGPVLDLSLDGKQLLGFTWTPRQSAGWWLPIDLSILEPGEYTISMAAYDAGTCVKVAEDIATKIEVEERAAEGPFFTNVSADGLDAEMETDTTYYFDITADATPRYLELLNDSLVREPNGSSCHLNEKETVFSWRLDLEGANASDIKYTHYMRTYFVGDPGHDGPWVKTPDPIDGGVRLDLGNAPMAHSYSAYGMGQHHYDCNTTFDDAELWNASMECAVYFTTPGTYHGELYLVGPDGEEASERVEVTITVLAKEELPPEPVEEAPPAPEPVAPEEPEETPVMPEPEVPAPEEPEAPTTPQLPPPPDEQPPDAPPDNTSDVSSDQASPQEPSSQNNSS